MVIYIKIDVFILILVILCICFSVTSTLVKLSETLRVTEECLCYHIFDKTIHNIKE